MSLSLAVRRARLAALASAIDAEGGGALHMYGSARPPMGGASAEPPLLIAALGLPAFEVHATDASMSFELEVNVAVSGQPVWARFVNGAGVAVMDLSVGLPGSGAQVIVSNGQPVPSAMMYPGGLVTVTCLITEPA
jgi:hypothetical protein